MTMLRNRFTSLRMNEADNLESHIKELRKVFNDLNIALLAESSDQLKELEFIQQLLVSLPESWQILVSVIPQRPEATDTNGTRLSIDIQSRLLAEYHRRQSQHGEKSFLAQNWNDPQNHRRNSPGHKRPDCWRPGGGAYRGDNHQDTPHSRENDRRNTGNRNDGRNGNNRNNNERRNNQNYDTNDGEYERNNDQTDAEHANFAQPYEIAFSFRFVDIPIVPLCHEPIPALPNRAVCTSRDIYFPPSLPVPTSFDVSPPLSLSDQSDLFSEDHSFQVFTLSEGELGDTLEVQNTVHISTQREEPESQTQGEHTDYLPATLVAVPAPPCTPDRSEHTHRPATPPLIQQAPIDRTVPGTPALNRRTTHQQAKQGVAPYKYMRIDDSNKPERILWLQALGDLHSFLALQNDRRDLSVWFSPSWENLANIYTMPLG
ncbi:hypothetical protein FRC10_012053 [Ceratobasidium sp. 414]|nr:hypothetical protein FRC10_012053 [Ceratobasidium sp. 414]